MRHSDVADHMDVARVFYICLVLVPVAFGALLSTDARAQSNNGNDASAASISYGGPFSLIDHNGRSVTDEDFRGEFMLVFFGYTNCPDVCPTGLFTMATTLDLLGPSGEQVRPVFISIDAKRDTVEQLAQYVTMFHPRLVGLTGTPRQIHEAARAYWVHYSIDEYKGEYLVGHTADTYLMAPDGRFLKYFAYDTSAEDMAAAITGYIEIETAATQISGE